MNGPPSHIATASRNTREHVSQLRLLIRDPQKRQRLIFSFSLLGLVIVSVLASVTKYLPLLPFDLAVTRELQAMNNMLFLHVMVFISLFGYMPWSAISVTVGVLLVGVFLGWQDGMYLLCLTVLQALANHAIKTAVGRPRPLNTLVDVFMPVSGNSFPSGHVMFYTVFFGFLFFVAWIRIPNVLWRAMVLIPTGMLIVLVGPSRMYLGAHWLSDVVAAYLFATIILAFGIEFYLRDLTLHAPTQ